MFPGLDPVVPGVYRAATTAGRLGPVAFDKGDKLWFSLAAAGRDVSTCSAALQCACIDVTPNSGAQVLQPLDY